MELRDLTLDDKYTRTSGRIYLTGVQALVRLPMMQQARDEAAGLRTAGFISGYRGSPLGTYDNALWGARALLEKRNVVFTPGVNEDLAATALWGTQQVSLQPDALYDGVFGIWYGKGPGVDRSTDALKHANAAGTSKSGGVLLLAGDDHGCQSSTSAHQSEQVLVAAMIPVLNPATVQDYLDMGLVGFAMSRYAGVWVGFKAVAEAVEGSATVDVDPGRVRIVEPSDFEMPAGGLSIRWPDPPLDQERRLHGPKMDAVRAFARANGLDRVVIDSPAARLGIATAGKAYLDVRQALEDLRIDDDEARRLGLRLYKIGMSWPLEPEGALSFARGLTEILVVEEKRAFIEDQLVKLLYRESARPQVHGKEDGEGRVLIPSAGELDPPTVAAAIVAALVRLHGPLPRIEAALERVRGWQSRAGVTPLYPVRTPFFCSGCPHNTSTRVPEGSRALGGIGCHWLAVQMPRETKTYSHMGGEGAAWIGQSPFVKGKHVFQNIGDGTYFHSGLLAIRAAVAANVDITYKLLYNDAVAMTGGQPVDGNLSVPQIAAQVAAEGARRVVVVTDDVARYRDVALPPGIDVHARESLDAVQRELREVPGTTVLIYDQTCAAEKRRRRKRGRMDEPPERVFINTDVCEGCGDCSTQSNCVSVKPVETELGRKRAIDQSACNKDYSCLRGFCPSFVTVKGAVLRKAAAGGMPAALPLPSLAPLDEAYGILVTGVGGTGVLTISALLGMAAHLEGKACTTLDFTGMAQKNGAVTSHVRIAAAPEDLHAVRLSAGRADLLVGCDLVVAASPASLARYQPGRTRAVVNASTAPTAGAVLDRDFDMRTGAMERALANALGAPADCVDASAIALARQGDAIGANQVLLGYAFQKGWLPVGLDALLRAIELNGVAVEAGKQAFAWGRHAALASGDAASVAPRPGAAPDRSTEAVVDAFAARLVGYQGAAYANRYREALAPLVAAERRLDAEAQPVARAAALSLYRLMAYKDEYEVARLYTDGAFRRALESQFVGSPDLAFHLAPPVFARKDPATGLPRKRRYGRWMWGAMRVLAHARLRGTALDSFGRSEERRMERALVAEFEPTLARRRRGSAGGIGTSRGARERSAGHPRLRPRQVAKRRSWRASAWRRCRPSSRRPRTWCARGRLKSTASTVRQAVGRYPCLAARIRPRRGNWCQACNGV